MVLSWWTNNTYVKKEFSLTATRMTPLKAFLYTACVLLSLNSKFVESEALPGRSIPINEKSSHLLPSSMLSVGLQPAVDSLLANEPNCSRWIWGTCYFNHGTCGEGKQHATRSGDGCRIIGITSRCYKECGGKNTQAPYKPPSILDDNIWGVHDLGEKTEPKPEPPKLEDENMYLFEPSWDDDDNIGGPFSMDEPPEEKEVEEGAHCRWFKASWGPCDENGQKHRVRKLRKNRDLQKSCPSQKRDSKSCGGKSLANGEVSETVELPRLDAPCKWNKEAKKCGKCEKSSMTCVMPLLGGNPAICGDERKFESDC